MQSAAPEPAPEAHRNLGSDEDVDVHLSSRPVVGQGILADPKMRESKADTEQGLSSAMDCSSAAHSRAFTHVEMSRSYHRPSVSTNGHQIDLHCTLLCPIIFVKHTGPWSAHRLVYDGNPSK